MSQRHFRGVLKESKHCSGPPKVKQSSKEEQCAKSLHTPCAVKRRVNNIAVD